MRSQLLLGVKAKLFLLFVCAASLVSVEFAFANDWSTAAFRPSLKTQGASAPMKKWSTAAASQTAQFKFQPATYSSVKFQYSGLALKTYVPSAPQKIVVPAAPSIPAPTTISGSGYVAAVIPRVNMRNVDWQYSEGIDPAILSVVRAGSKDSVCKRISFSADGYDFAGMVMAAKPNKIAVKADNSAWFGLIIKSPENDSITILSLALTDEGTADVSGIEVSDNGMSLRIPGVDPDGKPGTVDFDVVGAPILTEHPTACQLDGTVLTSGGVVYELVINIADGLNLLRVNSLAYENGAIVITD